MLAALGFVHGVVLLAFAAQTAPDGWKPRAIEPGEHTGEVAWGRSDSRFPIDAFMIRVPAAGRVTFEVLSDDIDAAMLVQDSQRPDEPGDSGSGADGVDPRLTFDVESGFAGLLIVASEDGTLGRYRLLYSFTAAGTQPSTAPDSLDEALRRLRRKAERAFERKAILTAIGYLARAGEHCTNRCSPDKAREWLEEALARAEAQLEIAAEASDDVLLATAYARASLASFEHGRGNDTIALELAARCTALLDGMSPSRVLVHGLEVKGSVESSLGRHEAAAETLTRCAAAAEALRDPVKAALVRSRLASALERRAPADAAALHDEVVARLEAVTARADAMAAALHRRASFRQRHGDIEGARADLERAVALPVSEWTRRDVLGQLGTVLLDLGDYPGAAARFEQVAAVDPCRDGTTLARALAMLAARQGDTASALRRYQGVLDALPAEAVQLRVDLLNDMGTLHRAAGDFAAARARYVEAFALLQDRPDEGREMRLRVNEARLLCDVGEFEAALDRLTPVASAGERLDDPVLLAVADANIAEALLETGDSERAKDLSRDAAERLHDLGEFEHALLARTTMARAALARGEFDEVEGLLARAEAEIDTIGVRPVEHYADAGRRSRFYEWGEIAQDLAAGLLAAPLAEEERANQTVTGFRREGRWKGRALLEGLIDRSGLREPDADLLETLRRRLPEDTLLVEIALGQENLYAYVLRGGKAESLRFVHLGERRTVIEDAERLSRGIGRQAALLGRSEIATLGEKLRKRLLDPVLAASGERPARLIVVPGHAFAALPWEALVIQADLSKEGYRGIRYVADEFEVAYAPSSTMIARLLEPTNEPPATGAVVFCDPDYEIVEQHEDTNDPAGAVRPFPVDDRWDPLPETRDEGFKISRTTLNEAGKAAGELHAKLNLLEDEPDVEFVSPYLRLFAGQSASVDRLLAEKGPVSVLHLACHGDVDPADPLRTGLVLAWDRWTGGRFTLANVARLRIRPDTVVLSACVTARGRVLKGEGVQSIANAFLAIGARRVVASLWNVKDGESNRLMRRFYTLWYVHGLAPSAALCQAKREMRTSGLRGKPPGYVPADDVDGKLDAAHPVFWAAFIYTGV